MVLAGNGSNAITNGVGTNVALSQIAAVAVNAQGDKFIGELGAVQRVSTSGKRLCAVMTLCFSTFLLPKGAVSTLLVDKNVYFKGLTIGNGGILYAAAITYITAINISSGLHCVVSL